MPYDDAATSAFGGSCTVYVAFDGSVSSAARTKSLSTSMLSAVASSRPCSPPAAFFAAWSSNCRSAPGSRKRSATAAASTSTTATMRRARRSVSACALPPGAAPASCTRAILAASANGSFTCPCHNGPDEGPEDPRRRLGGRPRLPLRLHARLVAALEGHGRSGHRPPGHDVPRQGDRVALVADGPESALPRGRDLRRGAPRRRAAEGRPLPAPRGVPPGGHARGQARTRGDLALRHTALAPPSRATRRTRAARRGRRLHGADEPLPRHPDRPAREARRAGRVLRRRRADEPARVRRHGHRLQL